MEHYPDKTLHITNELIHNPDVNNRLTEMKVNLVEKVGEGGKDFSKIQEGDVVILPAFGASYEEMEYFDKKVRNDLENRLLPFIHSKVQLSSDARVVPSFLRS